MSDEDDIPSSSFCEPQLKKARMRWQVRSSGLNKQTSSDDESPSCSKDNFSSSSRSESDLDGNQSSQEYEMSNTRRMVLTWRAAHTAKAVFDNTVNSMIEKMSLPFAEFDNPADDYSSDRSLEDQAVSMAIQSHGLHKPCTCARQSSSTPNVPCHIPYHHRTHTSLFGAPSTSSSNLRRSGNVEQDILSEAVDVAILSKGLGVSHGGI